MHVVTNTVRRGEREYSSTLLRRSYREGGKVKKQTLANLSHLPPELIELIRGALRGVHYLPADEAFAIERSLGAGHVNALLAMARKLDLAKLIDREPSRARDLVLAMICQRVLCPQSKLASARALSTLDARRPSSPSRGRPGRSLRARWTGSYLARSGSRSASPAGT